MWLVDSADLESARMTRLDLVSETGGESLKDIKENEVMICFVS